MEIDFDPVNFYSTENDLIESDLVKPVSDEHDKTEMVTVVKTITDKTSIQDGKSTEKFNNLRRSGRPKPAAESLLSSPPAIKFYESTVIRKSSDPKKRSASSLRAGKSSVSTNGSSPSKTLKLRLAGSNASKENLASSEATPKR